MSSINTSRVILGGLLAGVVINVGEGILNLVLVPDQMAALMERLGLPEVSLPGMIAYGLMAFLIGIVGVWLYAAARPRLGAGASTALRISGAVWFLAYGVPTVGFWAMGMLGLGLMFMLLAWGLLEIGLAVTAGAWLYREEGAAMPAAPSSAAQPSNV